MELGAEGWEKVADLARTLELDLIFDIFGDVSLKMAEDLGASAIKLHPTDFTNFDLIKRVTASSVKNVIAGCGGCTVVEIRDTLEEFKDHQSLTLLHGFQGYPTSTPDNCLSRLNVLNNILASLSSDVRLGFADHAEPLSADSTHLAAVSIGFGVSVVEKHLTLARCLQLEDCESALSPDEFFNFVKTMHSCYEARANSLCDENSFLMPESEKTYRKNVSRHVVSTSNLDSGQTVNPSDICLKRTSSANALTDPLEVIGKSVSNSIAKALLLLSIISNYELSSCRCFGMP